MTFFRFLMSVFVCMLFSAKALELTPTPKSVKSSGRGIVFSYQWSLEIEDAFGKAASWLKEDFEGHGWKIIPNATQVVIMKTPKNPMRESEAYTVNVSEGKIVLEAMDSDGMFRAVGRLISVLKNPAIQYDTESFVIPELTINDYPDIPLRLMDLTMPFWEPFSTAERLESSKKFINVMALHGFNAVVIGLGGYYVSKHFECKWQNPWTEKDIRELVAFCRSRGITPIPAINTIGHLENAPRIIILKNKEGKEIGHDITKDEFYTQYAKVLDELVGYFGNPPYFRVGGDEANAVFQTLGRSPHESEELFAKVFNFAAEHLAQYNCRPVIWHDMLFSKELGGKRIGDGISESQVLPAPNILKLLSKKIIINYWNYLSGPYDGAKELTDAGFDVWASTWHWPDAIWKLARFASKNGICAYDGTTWCNVHNKGGAMVLVGEYAWNTSRDKVTYDPDEVFMHEWSSIPVFQNSTSVKTLAFVNSVFVEGWNQEKVNIGTMTIDVSKPVAAAHTRIFPLKKPDDTVSLRKVIPQVEFFLQGPERFVMQIPTLNGPRLFASFALYTPSHGATTGTNMWGQDWTIDKDFKVIAKSARIPNVAIPADGGVISANETGGDVHMNVRKLMAKDQVTILAGYAEEGKEFPVLKTKVDSKATTIVLVFGSRLWMFTDRPCAAAKILIETTKGTKNVFTLNVDFPLAPDPRFHGNFDVVYLPKGMMAIIWRGNSTERPSEVSIQFTSIGASIGTTLLGAVSISEKNNHMFLATQQLDIEKIDANFKSTELNGRAVRFGDVRKAPFLLTGFPFQTSEDQPLNRLPLDMTEQEVNKGALQLARCHTGGAVLFRTDSPYIAIRASAPTMREMGHMPSTGVSGYDLYERCYNGGERFICNLRPNGGAVLAGGWIRKTMCDYILYLPLYAGTDSVEIGVAPEAKFESPTPQRIQKPIVFYGSSITQGGCASRPANNFTTMICRALDAAQVNLGFSGSGKGEPAVAHAIAKIDASVFVMDYDHNAPTPQHLRQTHEPFFKIIREARPDLPVIFISRPDTSNGGERMQIIRQTYENAVAAGDKNVYFIPGDTLFGPNGLNFCTVDGCHPNDLGFYRMYEKILPVVKKALHLE